MWKSSIGTAFVGDPDALAKQIDILRKELSVMMDASKAANPLFYEYHVNESSDPDCVLSTH